MTPLRWSYALGAGVLLVIALLAFAGCTQAGARNGPPTITFEAEGFLKVYRAERDRVIRETAPAYKKCATLPDSASAEQRRRCADLTALLAEWERRDAVIFHSVMSGKPVDSLDWEKIAEVAGKLIGTAAGVAL